MGNRQYNKVIPHTVKTEGISHPIMLEKILLDQIDLGKPFRLTIEYEPEMLNSRITVETD